MATTRGFVTRLEIGRGGLVTVEIVEADASRSTYVVSDIDGDPERFNERLTKVAVLRDAMNRAEPVEIEHEQGEFGREANRIARISRDALDPPQGVDQVSGLVLQVAVQSSNALQGAAEFHDDAQIVVLSLNGSAVALRLDLQAPERQAVCAQLEAIQRAYATGALCRFVVSRSTDEKNPTILVVSVGDATGGSRLPPPTVSGFIESLGLIPPPGGGSAPPALAEVRATTAPEFTGPGGTVDPARFTPADLQLYVANGSLTYQLVEAGLRDNLRMRLAYARLDDGRDPDDDNPDGDGPNGDGPAGEDVPHVRAVGEPNRAAPTQALLLTAELLAPLASASRPVWVHIDREMLDRGPDGGCLPGVPSSNLRVQSLRDLRIPYPAQWIGHGCFNHGVYRLQLSSPADSVIQIDGKPICLYPSDDERTRVGYACLDGDHCVTVEIPAYTCDTVFDLDVYRIR